MRWMSSSGREGLLWGEGRVSATDPHTREDESHTPRRRDVRHPIAHHQALKPLQRCPRSQSIGETRLVLQQGFGDLAILTHDNHSIIDILEGFDGRGEGRQVPTGVTEEAEDTTVCGGKDEARAGSALGWFELEVDGLEL